VRRRGEAAGAPPWPWAAGGQRAGLERRRRSDSLCFFIVTVFIFFKKYYIFCYDLFYY
jgi:hypothetical protein